MPDIDDHEIAFPEWDGDFDDIEDFEAACLRIINEKTELLIGHVSRDVDPLDYDGPEGYLEALCEYVEKHTPFTCTHPYGD